MMARAQISPGELSRAHAHLEGISNCKKCHELGKKVASIKCLDCHKEIQKLQSDKKGYHASGEVLQKECFDCHNEHHGRNFEITVFDTTKFNHTETGYLLEGKHLKVSCSNCHQGKNIIQNISQRKGFTYLGLGTRCLSCHEDYHQSTLPSNCLECHDHNGFSPASGFDHAKTTFPLTGKHVTLECIKCHKKNVRNGKEFQEFKGIAHNQCTSCHEDVHKNKFGNNCLKCHNENSFHEIKELSSFNHNQTNYPLQGRHMFLECKSCHKGVYTKRIAHKNCYDCHQDYHKSEFTSQNKKSDCQDCHTVDGFRPSNFTLQKHNQLKFKLNGAHAATPCFVCHQKSDGWSFRNLGLKCIDCHENIHRTEISVKYIPEQNCSVCHNEENWQKIQFDHSKTEFKLEGKHKEPTCRECHFKKDDLGFEKQLFSSISSHCLNCHKDQHNEQFEQSSEASCKTCHTYNSWVPDLFNHDKARFKLDGKHKNVECRKCHSPISNGLGTYILYKNNKTQCIDCHS